MEDIPKILVVERDDALRESLLSIATEVGAKGRGVDSGLDALEALKNRKYRPIIFLGYDLNGIKAIDICIRLRSDGNTSDLLIVFLTPVNNDEYTLKAFDAGASECIDFPFNEAVFSKRLRPLIRRIALSEDLSERNKELATGNAALAKAQKVLAETHKTLAEEINVARHCQLALAPEENVASKGCRIATASISSTKLSGDFMESQLLRNGSTSMFVADVSGHGAGPALIASSVKAFMAAHTEDAPTPAHLMVRLVKFTRAATLETQFVSAVCARYSPEEKVFTVAHAGAPPIYLQQKSGGALSPMWRSSLPLGTRGKAGYANQQVAVSSGDRVVFFTDGLYEHIDKDGDVEVGLRLVRACIRRSANKPLEDVAHFLIKEIEIASGGSFDDDVSVMIWEAT